MSQHYFDTIHDDQETSIFMGWDSPLQGFFLVIEKGYGADEPFWCNLEYEPSHPTSLSVFLKVLDYFGIQIPNQMIEELLQDQIDDFGNKKVFHSFVDGKYTRTEY